MSRALRLPALLIAVMLLLPAVTVGCGQSPGQKLYNRAQEYEESNQFTEATKEYRGAQQLLKNEGREELATRSRMAVQRIAYYTETYPLLAPEVKQKLAEAYPQVSQAERDRWLSSGELEHITWDGKVHYFAQAVENIPFRHLEVMRLNTESCAADATLVTTILEKFAKPTTPEWQPYSKPLTWIGTTTLSVPRDKLPTKGTLNLWFPCPVIMAPQDTVTLMSVTPDTYIKQPASLDEDISLAYMEVPLEKLSGNLDITLQFQFTHYTENFQVNPANVGAYDKSDPTYKRYTRSYGNTFISEPIRDTAKKVVGNEKNPYLAARKLYKYVLKDIKYSFMPHETLWPRGERESVYVHRMKRGDCGAQSMYFSALCRSVGIPARTTGGWQLFSRNFGDHFWAEFFLPNYGWIPVDTTVAEVADYPSDAQLTEQQRAEFKDFYFGGQDPLRCNVQLDVDEPLIPPATEDVQGLAIQEPVATCSTMEESPSDLIAEYYKMSAQVVGPPLEQSLK
jgi:transglutaminase-like putative cysteine protease